MKSTQSTRYPGTTVSAGDVPTRNTFSIRLTRRLWPLTSAALCTAARRATRLDDFGDPPVEPQLTVLLNSLEREADFHPLGRVLMRTHLVDLLKTRLQLVAAWKSQPPSVAVAPVSRPIFITGMPRSGSTFLHELMAADPNLRAPRVWELMSPLTAIHPDRGWGDSRVRHAAACLWWFRRLAPEADAVYPMRARTPHECVAIHSYTFMSEEFISSCRIPTYETFLRSSDLTPIYQWEKRFLQHLQQFQPARRWILKAPDHVYGLEAIFRVFPDAYIIQTHRDPLEVLKSTIHLTRVLQNLYTRPADPHYLAEREARILVAAMDRFIQFRDTHPELAARFIDVSYSDITSRPLAVIDRIYHHCDQPLTAIAAANMRALTSHRTRYHSRRAAPALVDFGLDVPGLARRFDGYCHRFGIRVRQPAH